MSFHGEIKSSFALWLSISLPPSTLKKAKSEIVAKVLAQDGSSAVFQGYTGILPAHMAWVPGLLVWTCAKLMLQTNGNSMIESTTGAQWHTGTA